MKPHIINCKSGRIIVNALSTGEVSAMVDSGRGTMGAILTIAEAKELGCALIAAIRTAPERG